MLKIICKTILRDGIFFIKYNFIIPRIESPLRSGAAFPAAVKKTVSMRVCVAACYVGRQPGYALKTFPTASPPANTFSYFRTIVCAPFGWWSTQRVFVFQLKQFRYSIIFLFNKKYTFYRAPHCYNTHPTNKHWLLMLFKLIAPVAEEGATLSSRNMARISPRASNVASCSLPVFRASIVGTLTFLWL